MKLSHFDTWSAKLFAFVIIIGGLWWLGYAVRDHYIAEHLCKCALSWSYLPFVVSGLAIMFSLAILSQKATAAAAAVVLPFIDRIRLGKVSTSTMVVPAQPATRATVVTTTTTPLPVPPKVTPASTDVTGTPFDEEEGK